MTGPLVARSLDSWYGELVTRAHSNHSIEPFLFKKNLNLLNVISISKALKTRCYMKSMDLIRERLWRDRERQSLEQF